MRLGSILVCPTDRIPLILDKNSGHCPKCGIKYENTEGIWKLYSVDDQLCRQSDVVEWFDSRAEKIEDEQILRGAPDKWHGRFFEKDMAEIQRFLSFKDTDYFLDIGCGNGLFLEQYAGFVKQAVGTDISFKMLERARQHLKRENILLVQANSLKLPFRANTFDAILCNWVIHYFRRDEVPKFFLELKRVAKKHGRVFLGEIPLERSLRNYEAKVGHFLVKRLKIKVSDRYLSPVETTKFTPREIEGWAKEAGLNVVSKGTMRHVFPSLRILYVGQLVSNRVQHLFERYDYKRSIPLVSHSYFFVLRS